jgi:DnaJ family protein A protein 3
MLQIVPGTSSHTRIRLSGKGMKNINSFGYGDHYVNLKISVPRTLNEKQRALIQAYAELEEDTPGIIQGFAYKKDGECMMMITVLIIANFNVVSL